MQNFELLLVLNHSGGKTNKNTNISGCSNLFFLCVLPSKHCWSHLTLQIVILHATFHLNPIPPYSSPQTMILSTTEKTVDMTETFNHSSVFIYILTHSKKPQINSQTLEVTGHAKQFLQNFFILKPYTHKEKAPMWQMLITICLKID